MSDMREYKCISCGKTTMATKFASSLKVQCDDCKGKPANPAILEEIKQKRNKKSSSRSTIAGNQKESTCVECGAPTMIGKFASHKTALCPACKGTGGGGPSNGKIKIDLNKIDRSTLPDLEDMYVVPTVIADERLQKVICPKCEHAYMKIVKILDSSDWGLVLTYQCENCLGMMIFSEQARHLIRPSGPATLFSYSGREIKTMLSPVAETRYENYMLYLIDLCEQHGIKSEPNKLPEYITKFDKKKYFEEHKDRIKGINENLLRDTIIADKIDEIRQTMQREIDMLKSKNEKLQQQLRNK